MFLLMRRSPRFEPLLPVCCHWPAIVLSLPGKQVERIDMLCAPDIVCDSEQTCARILVNNSPSMNWLDTERFMLHSMKDLEGYTIGATDGVIGHVKDFYFDDEAWVIRYLVVETGAWLSSRRVLISPIAINEPNWSEKSFPAAITQEQVKNSPNIDTDKPVSRQHEVTYSGYYGYPYYWGGGGFWSNGVYPGMMLSGVGHGGQAESRTERARNSPIEGESEQRQQQDAHLRSGNAITSYDIHATDGDIGHVQGILIDERSWAIRYLIVNTSNWWLGHQVLIAPQWIEGVSWEDRRVSVSLTRDAVRSSPAHPPGTRTERDEETRIHDHYGRPGYWAREVQLQNPEFHTIPSVSPGAIGKTFDGVTKDKHHEL
jgi:hypothetical protein